MYKVEQHDDGLWGLYEGGEWVANYISKKTAEKAALTLSLYDKLNEAGDAAEDLLETTEGWGARQDLLRFRSLVEQMLEMTEEEISKDLCSTRQSPVALLLAGLRS